MNAPAAKLFDAMIGNGDDWHWFDVYSVSTRGVDITGIRLKQASLHSLPQALQDEIERRCLDPPALLILNCNWERAGGCGAKMSNSVC